jgi:fimbrial isopeptide formation D2 family protein/uncharacterized repeat protein (TIGR01451 family)
MKRQNSPLLLEQLEDRIFLDANPLVVVDGGVDHIADSVVEVSVEPVIEPVATEPEIAEQQDDAGDGGVVAEDASTGDSVNSADGNQSATSDQDDEADVQDDGASDSESFSTAGSEAEQEVSSDEPEISQEPSGDDSSDSQEPDSTEDSLESSSDSATTVATVTATDANTADPAPIDPMIGENFEFTVSFNNDTGSDVFGPYIDLLLDGGQDGNDAVADDGITFVDATYLGADVESWERIITQDDVDNGITHPWATDAAGDPLVVFNINGDPLEVGDQFVSLLMPFGSFTTDQPAADVQIVAHMGVNADLDAPLDVNSTTGAMFGHDPLNNPVGPPADPPLRDINQISAAYVPEVITYRKDIIVSNVGQDCQDQHDGTGDIRHFADDGTQIFEQNHQEIPTGPNFPATYVAEIDIADGQTVTGLNLTEHLPADIVFTGNVTVQVGGVDVAFTESLVGNDLVITLTGDVTGTGNVGADVVITYDFYVADVLDSNTGDDGHIVNDGVVGYSWDPATGNQGDANDDAIVNGTIDPEVNDEGHFSDRANVDDISHSQSIAIQKSHGPGQDSYVPGETLNYSLDFQVSDYFSFGDNGSGFQIDDVVADGLMMQQNGNGAFTATIEIWENGHHYSQVLAVSANNVAGEAMWTTTGTLNADGTVNDPSDLVVHYNMQQILIDMGVAGGILHGDISNDGLQGGGATHGKITYSADIEQSYETEPNGGANGDDSDVDQGDILDGGVTIIGDVYNNDTNTYTGDNEADESCDSLSIAVGSVEKDIFAVTSNGATTTYSDGTGAIPTLHISPGDTVTYILHYEMPLSSTEDFQLTDYLPLPIFDADGTGWAKDDTEYDGSNGAPLAGAWAYTNHDTYHDLAGVLDPTVSADGAQNALVFDWDPYHSDDNGSDVSAVIEIVFTVTASSEPFADNMFLTNQVRATEAGTALTQSPTDDIVQIVLDEPELNITKGAVETNNDHVFFPLNANVHTFFTEPEDHGNRLEQNITSDWLDANIIDTNLINVDAGDIVTMAIVVENTGHSDAYDVTIADVLPAGYSAADNIRVSDGAGNILTFTGDLFDAAGLTIDDTAGHGPLDAYDPTSGLNIIVITYDVVLQGTVAPQQGFVNTATVTNYRGADDATVGNHVPEGISDTAFVRTDTVDVDKTVASTSQAHTADPNVTIGETVTYSVLITLPEGTATNVTFTDIMDPDDGLEVIDLVSLSSSSGDIVSSHGDALDDAFLAAHGTIAADGLSLSIDFGDLENQNRDNDVAETITLTYTALVRNILPNQDTAPLRDVDNTAQWNWTDGANVSHNATDTETITIVEPNLQVTKSVPAGLTPDAGDTFTYTLLIEHSGTSSADAFDAAMNDPLLAGLTFAGNLASSGAATSSLAYNAGTNTIDASWLELDQGASTTITFDVTVDDPIQAGTDLTNKADITWTSLPGADPNERTGDGGVNDYTDSDTLTLMVAGTIDKEQPVPAVYTIGDEVTYNIVVSLPEGNTENLVVNDVLPPGLQYVSHVIDDAGYNGTVNAPTTNNPVGDGDDIVFTFNGTTTTNSDGDTDNNSFIIRVTTLVTSSPSNQQNQTLTNEASMSYDDPAGGRPITIDDPTDPIITVAEPQITTLKSVVDSGDAGTDASPGEMLTYTARFTNSGDSTAYEVNAVDTLAPGTEFGAFTNISSSFGAIADPTMTDNGDGTVSIAGDWDIAVDQWVEIQYTVTVMSAGFTAGNYTNTVDADWTSQDGDDANERVYDDTPGITVDGDLDDDDAVFTVITDGSIGDTVFFDADGDGGEFSAAAGDTTPDVGIDGVTVRLYADVNGDGDFDDLEDLLDTQITSNGGQYLFSDLPEYADYMVVVDPDLATADGFSLTNAGYSPTYNLDEGVVVTDHTATSISLATGEHRTDVDFGYTGENSIGDYVWSDINGDGNQGDPGELGIGGVTLQLQADIDGDGEVDYTATTVTATDGSYSFDHLPFSDMVAADGPDFTVTVTTPPANSVATYDLDGNLDNIMSFDLNPDGSDFTGDPADHRRDDIDFGYQEQASVGDYVWHDLNADGVQDAGETGIGNITVDLLDDAGGVVASTTTAADGSYNFTGLTPDDYQIQFGTPVDYVFSPLDSTSDDAADSDANPATGLTEIFTLGAGENDSTWDAGVYQTASLGDTVWEDMNGDGIQDPGELGIDGVTVNLFDSDENLVATTVTAGGGIYDFSDLTPGNYYVTVTPLAGYTLTELDQGGDDAVDSDIDPITGRTAVTTLTSGEDDLTWDVGLFQPASIGDFVWDDTNGDGIQDPGETGLVNVTVNLYDGAGNLVTTTTTAADGSYLFADLAPGDYATEFIAPTGYTISPQNQGGDETADSDADPASGRTALVTLGSGDNYTDLDAGMNSTTASIGDFVFNDLNADGIQDAGETGIGNVAVNLYDAAGHVVNTTTTAADGSYSFAGLQPGDYSVEFVPPAGYSISPQNQGGDDAADSDVDPATNRTETFTLDAGENDPSLDAGMYEPASIGNQVWEDTNGNGVQDAGEAGIDNVTVNLYDGGGNLVGSTTTAGGGLYEFTSLIPDDYFIEVVSPAGYLVTEQDQGGNDAVDSDIDPTTGRSTVISLTSGENDSTWDAGLFQPASIGDFVWDDIDADGVQDPGETGLVNVTVNLYDGAGNLVTTTTTAADGSYLFADLAPGDYATEFIAPTGYTISPPNAGGDNVDSDADPNTGRTPLITLDSGQNIINIDAGMNNTTASIGDFVWEDLNANGVQDAGESGLGNVSVNLYDNAGTLINSTTTAADGSYNFAGLVPANGYSVEFLPPTDYLFSPQDQGLDTTDSDADQTSGRTGSFDLAAGENNPTIDAGLYRPVDLGNFVWEDLNGDGVQNPGEPGIGNVTVNLYDSTGAIVATTTTAPDGSYNFVALTPGDYEVQFLTPDGFIITAPNQGGDDAADSNADITGRAGVVLVSGVDDPTMDTGMYHPATVGDYIWNDTNGDGVQDLDESGIGGVLVNLYDGSGNLVASTRTNPDGSYTFTGLASGNYSITVVAPGYDPTFDADGLTTPNTTSFSLVPGEINMDIDFGYVPLPQGAPVVPPVQPPIVVPTQPVAPVIPVTTIAPSEPGIVPDAFFMYRESGDRIEDDIFFYPFEDTPWLEPMLPVSPMYSGHAEPGTTLSFILHDAMGNEIGHQTVMADTAGNWIVSFPGSLMFDQPHDMVIDQTSSTYNASSDGFYNLRTYFNPNFTSMVFSSTHLDVESIFALLPSTVMQSIHASNLSTLNLEWNDFNGYEFFAPSTHPAKSRH